MSEAKNGAVTACAGMNLTTTRGSICKKLADECDRQWVDISEFKRKADQGYDLIGSYYKNYNQCLDGVRRMVAADDKTLDEISEMLNSREITGKVRDGTSYSPPTSSSDCFRLQVDGYLENSAQCMAKKGSRLGVDFGSTVPINVGSGGRVGVGAPIFSWRLGSFGNMGLGNSGWIGRWRSSVSLANNGQRFQLDWTLFDGQAQSQIDDDRWSLETSLRFLSNQESLVLNETQILQIGGGLRYQFLGENFYDAFKLRESGARDIVLQRGSHLDGYADYKPAVVTDPNASSGTTNTNNAATIPLPKFSHNLEFGLEGGFAFTGLDLPFFNLPFVNGNLKVEYSPTSDRVGIGVCSALGNFFSSSALALNVCYKHITPVGQGTGRPEDRFTAGLSYGPEVQ